MHNAIAPNIVFTSFSSCCSEGGETPQETQGAADSDTAKPDSEPCTSQETIPIAQSAEDPMPSSVAPKTPEQPIVAGPTDTFQLMHGEILKLAELFDAAAKERDSLSSQLRAMHQRAPSAEIQLGEVRDRLRREREISGSRNRALRASQFARVEAEKSAANHWFTLQRMQRGAHKADEELRELSEAVSETQRRAMEAEGLITGALQALTPILGAESPIASSLTRSAEMLEGALRLYAKTNERLAAARGELAHARDVRLPNSSATTLSHLIAAMLANMEQRLAWAFNDASAEELHTKCQALSDSIGIVLARRDIGHSSELVDHVIATALASKSLDIEVRGHVHEIIRVGHLLRKGKKIDDVSVIVYNMEIDGWTFDRSTGRISRVRMCNDMEIDAKGEEVLIELKTISLNTVTSRMLEAMLDGNVEEANRAAESGNGNRMESISHAVKLANQFLRYREAIARGIGRSLELHITSYESPPLFVVQAIHRLFDKDTVSVIWYNDILAADGQLIEPTPPRQAADSAMPIPTAPSEPPPIAETKPVAAESQPQVAPGPVDILGENPSARFAFVYPDASADDLLQKEGLLRAAIDTLGASVELANRQTLVDHTIKTFTDITATPAEVRGTIHEIVRIAHIIRSGRKIESVADTISLPKIDGWGRNDRTGGIMPRKISGTAETGARSGDTLIAPKGFWLGGNVGRILEALLKGSAAEANQIIRSSCSGNKQSDAGRLAMSTANQLIRYRMLIARGLGKRFELHVTSADQVPQFVTNAIHRFFGAGVAEIIWYSDITSAEGTVLIPAGSAPPASTRSDAPQSEPPSDAPESIASLPPSVERPKEDRAARVGWSSVKTKRARDRFNVLLKKSTGKQPIDWDQPHTKGIQNADIVKTLSMMKEQPGVSSSTELNAAIGGFITYLRRTYAPGSYFKTKTDGSRLIDVVKRYIWSIEDKNT